jgi:pimeloyl-ACP methyl ester carboxylesterase
MVGRGITNFPGQSEGAGFDASVFVNGDDVVISFRGTDLPGLGPTAADFWWANVPATRGSYSEQVRRATEVIADAMDKYAGKTITLAGHSLGGGLATIMAIFFDLEAYVIAPAPFEFTARDRKIPHGQAVLRTRRQHCLPSHARLDLYVPISHALLNRQYYPLRDNSAGRA